MAYVYFTSYARLDAQGTKLQKVFDKLRVRVRARLGLNEPGELDTIAFVDAKDIQTGEEWQERLAAAVHQARVLVCFFSPTYFNSEYCAKEFAVFRRRMDRLGAGGPRPRAIIPVVWEIGVMPSAVAQHQYTNERFPATYASQGLRALYALKSSRDDAEKAIDVLADAICDAATGALPALDSHLDFNVLPRSFDNPGPYGIALAALTPRGPQRRIGVADTIARVVDRVAHSLAIPWWELPVNASLPDVISTAHGERHVVVVVTDDASSRAEPFATYLEGLLESPVPLVVLVGAPPPPTEPVASAALQALAGLELHAIESFALDNAESLASRLAKLVSKRRAALVHGDPLARVDDPQIVAAADREGIATATRPGLHVPGGATR